MMPPALTGTDAVVALSFASLPTSLGLMSWPVLMTARRSKFRKAILQARLPRLERGTYGFEVRCSILIELQARVA